MQQNAPEKSRIQAKAANLALIEDEEEPATDSAAEKHTPSGVTSKSDSIDLTFKNRFIKVVCVFVSV